MRQLLVMSLLALVMASCGLSSREKAMVGQYFIPEISDIDPLYELGKDGRSVMRAVRPEVLTATIHGRWHVKDDSLVIENDLATLRVDGDSSLMGAVAQREAYPITDFNGVSLTLNKDGIDYIYHRRPFPEDKK